jgi:CheY-like chemotaxis protein
MEKRRILIIDDEARFTRMVKLNLERTGEFEVREENRATSALATAREFKPHLILLDVIMPSMDGGDVANQIKRDKELRNTPIIFLTAAVAPEESGKKGLPSGGEFFLGKPVSLDDLIRCIKERTPQTEPLNPEI